MKLLKAEEIAKIYSVKKSTILRWGRIGKIERQKINQRVIRFPQKEKSNE